MQTSLLQEAQVEIQEQKFTVQQDCINVMQTITDAMEVLKYFKNEPDHPMIRVTLNRLILQVNLSNTIHFDLKEKAESTNINEQLNISKNHCKNLCQTYFQTNPIDSKLSPYLEHYLNQNLNKNTVLNQLQGLPSIKQQTQFNSQVIEKMFVAMAQTDESYDQIRKGEKIDTLTMSQLQTKLQKRRQQAAQKILNNWPQDAHNDNGIRKGNDEGEGIQQNEGKGKGKGRDNKFIIIAIGISISGLIILFYYRNLIYKM